MSADPNPSEDTRARLPLREARVEVRPVPGKSGAYDADRVDASVAAVRGVDRLDADGRQNSCRNERKQARSLRQIVLPARRDVEGSSGIKVRDVGDRLGPCACNRSNASMATVGLNRRRRGDFLDRFLSESSLALARCACGSNERRRARDHRGLSIALNRQVALIDRLINEQVNAILHHPDFQRLEASWRGLAFLTRREASEAAPSIKIKVMDVSWSELGRDLDRAIEFDQSEFFRKIYESEFGSPGGEPFGALIGDYEIHPRLTDGARYDDLDVLKSIAGVAAAAFCPFLANASPSMFGLGDFAELQQHAGSRAPHEGSDKWQALRDHEDARFVGLALPRVLMRLPYRAGQHARGRLSFAEDVAGGYHADGPDHRKFLWGGAAFALGAVILRAFENSGVAGRYSRRATGSRRGWTGEGAAGRRAWHG